MVYYGLVYHQDAFYKHMFIGNCCRSCSYFCGAACCCCHIAIDYGCCCWL